MLVSSGKVTVKTGLIPEVLFPEQTLLILSFLKAIISNHVRH